MQNQQPVPNIKPRRTLFINEDGDDANDGLTFKTAKRTLASIERIVCPGDIVYCGPESSGTPPRLSGEIAASGSTTPIYPVCLSGS